MIRRDLKDLSASLAGNVSVQLVGLVTAILAARLFSPAARGELATAVAWGLTFSVIVDLGVSQAVPFYAAKKIRGIGATSIAVAVATALPFAPACFLMIYVLGPELPVAAIVYSILVVPIGRVVTYVGSLFLGDSRVGSFSLSRILGSLPYLLGLLVAGVSSARTTSVVLLTALSMSLVVGVGLSVWASRSVPSFGSPNLPASRLLMSYGLRTFLGNLAWTGNQSVPLLLLSGIAGTAALGYYSVAQSYAVIPFVVASAFALLAPGRIASQVGMDAIRASRRLCLAGIAATWLTALALAPLAGVAIPWVFGGRYAPSVAPAALLVFASALIGTNFVLSASLRALGEPGAPSWAELAGLALTLGIGPVLVGRLGGLGAALAMLTSAALVTPILATFLRTSHRKPPAPLVKISVLTPAYNAAEYIDELVSSVQRQEYRNFEHIVIDDGSTDNTFELLQRHRDVKVIRRANKGQYATQNELLGLASGEVVVFVSADDYLASPIALQRVAETFAANPASDVVVGHTPRKIEGKRPYLVRSDVPLWLGIRTVRSCLAVPHCSVFVKRELIDRHAIRFDESYRTCGDWDFLIRIFSAARRVRTVPEDLGIWRQHPTQTSVTASDIGRLEVARVLARHGISPQKYLLLRQLYRAYSRLAHLIAILTQHGPNAVWRKLHARRRRLGLSCDGRR